MYDLTLGQMVILVKWINQKKHMCPMFLVKMDILLVNVGILVK